MTLRMIRLTPSLTVSGQPVAADFASLAAEGVTLVMSNRPDSEDPGQPTAEEESALAKQHGMQFRHIPVTYASISRADVDAYAAALATGGRVHAHCRSGPRSAVLWALVRILHDGQDPAKVAAEASQAGLDVSPAMAWLARSSS